MFFNFSYLMNFITNKERRPITLNLIFFKLKHGEMILACSDLMLAILHVRMVFRITSDGNDTTCLLSNYFPFISPLDVLKIQKSSIHFGMVHPIKPSNFQPADHLSAHLQIFKAIIGVRQMKVIYSFLNFSLLQQ